MTLNGSAVSLPVLIYIDEIHIDMGTVELGVPGDIGTVVCRSESRARVGWHLTTGQPVTDHDATLRDPTPRDFKQIRTSEAVTPSQSRLSLNRRGIERTDALTNGLWLCRLNGIGEGTFEEQVDVGIYQRGGGE